MDLFHPNVSGVESHVYMLSANLIKRGHKVHSPNRIGIHWLLPSPKVYHLPFVPIASSAILPNFSTFLPYLRTILIREHIHLIPAHASLSSLSHEGILHSHLLGVRMVFTDHSLFGFKDTASILTNKLLVGTLRNVDAVICLFDKSGRVQHKVYVILNALVPEHFQPETLKTSDIGKTWLPVTFDLLTSSHIDLLVTTAPRICNAFLNICFVVVIDLPQMHEKHNLQDGIELLRPIRPNAVRSVLMRGAIFLDTSLMDPLVSPSSRWLAQGYVFRAISEAIEMISDGKHDPIHAHERVKTFYDWAQVAERTEVVYDTDVKSRQMELWERTKRTMGLGPFAGPVYLIILWFPRDDMDFVVRHWDCDRFAQCINQDPQAATAWP
ncbi:PIGA-domain-containing protein [Armillaria gallica]|uniref:PIGA-domain-containing protein n=1 Tax=Armillaria gallica TaxID=47427 RepID=A0A2H3DKG2_ARMGA|nr:PIGA-domain-containing protein [Armillaria gallica]